MNHAFKFALIHSRPKVVRGKLIGKIPMSKTVVDHFGQVWDYTFENGSLEYIYRGSIDIFT